MIMKQSLVTADDLRLQGEGRHCAERADRLCSKLGTFSKDLIIHLLELRLVSDPEISRCKNDWHRREDGQKCKLPAKVESYCYTADNIEYCNDDDSHVDAKELLELCRVSSHSSCQSTNRVIFSVVMGDGLLKNILKIFSAIVCSYVLSLLVRIKKVVDILTNETALEDHPKAK
jgi:hypothetical protein